MSLLFFDGFDGYDAGSDLFNFGGWQPTIEGTVAPITTVRTGSGKSLQVGWSGAEVLPYMFASDQSAKTVYIGFAFDKNVTGNNVPILYFLNSSKAIQIKLYVNSSDILELRDTGGTVLATGTTVLTKDVWFYIELKLKIANSGGVFDCRISSNSEFTYSGDTQWQATDSLKYVWWTCNAPMSSFIIDDVYICNSDGGTNNTYLGEQRAEIITPTSDSSVAWAHNTGTTNWDAINEAIGAPDDDTTYVSSSTSSAKDEYGLSDLSGVNAVAGVKLVTRAEKDDVNPLSFKHGIKSGATDQQVTYTLGVGYAGFINIFETSDGVSTPFNSTTINSLLSTIEVV